MDLMKLGMSLLANKLGGEANGDAVGNVLSGLLGGGSEGGLNIAGLVERMTGSETSDSLTDLARSWLGDGDNMPISTDQVKELFGSDRLQQAAAELGEDEESLAEKLTDVLPSLVDQSSSGGSLLDSLGGIDGIANMARKWL